MSLSASMEDYLKAVLILHEKRGYVRCVDVAEYLGVTKSSVSRAVRELSKKEYLQKNVDGLLSLTEQGQQIARQIYEKHIFFSRQLRAVGVPANIAEQDACKIEHIISEESFDCLKRATKWE